MENRWLLLIHQLPPTPPYLRVKIGRRLQRLGAVAIKNSVYCLPRTEQAREDFQWVLREVAEGGGEALLVEARVVEGLSDEALEGLFRSAREADYQELAEAARRLLDEGVKGRAVGGELGRLKRWLAEVNELDFFGATGREAAESLLVELEQRMHPSPAPAARGTAAAPSGATWVTRTGIKVDRIGSAWLIRRFIDPRARFKFVPAQGYAPEAGELRFDMFDAEYTHQGDRCTFEVLLERFQLTEPALHQVAELVHDVDLKDGKFGRPEVAGLERLIAGLARSTPEDEARLAQGSVVFSSLYEAFKAQRDDPH